MGQPVDFKGTNMNLLAPEGAENVSNMRVFTNGTAVVQCWRLDDKEAMEVYRKGFVWIAVFSKGIPPLYISDEEGVRDIVADYGVWPRR